MDTYPHDPEVRFTLYGSPRGVQLRGDVGKWVFEIPMGDFTEPVWTLITAVRKNRIAAVMIGNWRVTELYNGNNIACVFCPASDKATVLQTLLVLRDLGFTQTMRFKTDEATLDGIRRGVGLHKYIWKSDRDDLIEEV